MWKRVNVQLLSAWLVIVAGLTILSTVPALAAGTAEPAVVKLTNQDRIALILSCLTDAINNPNPFNCDLHDASLTRRPASSDGDYMVLSAASALPHIS